MEQANPGKEALISRTVSKFTEIYFVDHVNIVTSTLLQKKMVATRMQAYAVIMTVFTGNSFFVA